MRVEDLPPLRRDRRLTLGDILGALRELSALDDLEPEKIKHEHGDGA